MRLRLASLTGHDKIAKVLFWRGEEVHALIIFFQTAVYTSHPKGTSESCGTDTPNRYGGLPVRDERVFHLAAYHGRITLVELLSSINHANLRMRTRRGERNTHCH